jgi:1-deoxy-D-xylulose-5-phosphate synthase
VDAPLVRTLLTAGVPVVTVEDHALAGGFGAAVLEAAAEMGLDASRVVRLGLPDAWVYQDSRARQLAEVGIDADGIARAIRRAAEARESPPMVPVLAAPRPDARVVGGRRA